MNLLHILPTLLLVAVAITYTTGAPAGPGPAPGMLEEVSLGTILTEIQVILDEKPDDPVALHALARTHARAYAKKLADTDKLQRHKGHLGVYVFGSPPYIFHLPYRGIVETDDGEKQAKAEAHLTAALAAYENLFKRVDNPGATERIGLAWCQAQAGQLEAAKAILRGIESQAWEAEGGRKFIVDNSFYHEVSDYLLPILDPGKDAAEIAEIENRRKAISSKPNMVR